DRQPRLPGLAGDRRQVHDEGLAVLGAGGAQHLRALAVEEDDRADVDGDLQVDVLRLLLGHRGADADAGVVDEHIEAAEALAVASDDRADRVLVGHVRRQVLDLQAVPAQPFRRLLERVRLARRDRQPVALLPERFGDRETDPSRGSGDDGGTVWHWRDLSKRWQRPRKATDCRWRPAGAAARA